MGKIIDINAGELQTEQRKGEIREKALGNGRDLSQLVDRAQTTFVPGRSIGDNIMLA